MFKGLAVVQRYKKASFGRAGKLLCSSLCSNFSTVSLGAEGSVICGMTTSKRVAHIAGKELRNPKTPKKYRPTAASALEQSKGLEGLSGIKRKPAKKSGLLARLSGE